MTTPIKGQIRNKLMIVYRANSTNELDRKVAAFDIYDGAEWIDLDSREAWGAFPDLFYWPDMITAAA